MHPVRKIELVRMSLKAHIFKLISIDNEGVLVIGNMSQILAENRVKGDLCL